MIRPAYRVPAMTGQPQSVGWRGPVPLYRAPARRPDRGFPWGAIHPWGLDQDADQVTIFAGEFAAGGGVVLATPETTFQITEDAQYIGLSYDPAVGSLALIAPTTDKPVPDGNIFRTWLYLFALSNGVATLVRHNLTGGWHAALFAYEPNT